MNTLEVLVRVFMTSGAIGWLVGSVEGQQNVLVLCQVFVLIGAAAAAFGFFTHKNQGVEVKQDCPVFSLKELIIISGSVLFVLLLLTWEGPLSAILPVIWLSVEGTILALVGAAIRIRHRFGKLGTFIFLLALLASGMIIGLDVASFYDAQT